MRRFAMSLTAAALALGIVAAPVSARTAPSPSIVDVALAVNAETGEFDTLIAAVLAADPAVLATLTRQRQLTVFAPTDAAFAAIGLTPATIGSLSRSALTQVLLHHVAPGARDAADVVASSRIRTLDRGFLDVSIQGGSAYVDDARIVAVDIHASNGIIHVIDGVLLP